MAAVTSEPTAYRIASEMYLTDIGAAIYLSPLKWIVMLAPLGFVMFMSFSVNRSYQTLLTTFWAFAAVMGISLSTVFLVFKIGSVVQVLFMTAATFGALSLYGYTTRRSLSAMGTFMMMGLFGIIIASVVNIFVQSSALQFGLNVLGILVFAGLTAWDTQRLKDQYDEVVGDAELVGKVSVMGALTLYLDFINMFQLLLQLFGQRNND
jgi:FtsH-binding integral membrane protein